MRDDERVSIVAGYVSAGGTVIAALVAGYALRVSIQERARSLANERLQRLFYLHEFLSRQDVAEARFIVRTQLAFKPVSSWSVDERQAANLVCSTYDQAGLFLRDGVVAEPQTDLFLRSSWGTSICDQYEILQRYLATFVTPTMTGREFFRHFVDLAGHTLALPQHAGRAPIAYPRLNLARHLGGIRSGGQTGVDRAALDAALAIGVPYAGWVPKGGVTEDPAEGDIRTRYTALKESESSDPAIRTERNVIDSDATLVIRPAGISSTGTDQTIDFAIRHHRPYFVSDGSDARNVAIWLGSLAAGRWINIAGPRASEWGAGYETSRRILSDVFNF